MIQPRVSILIPNYNNGRESSADGRFDLLGTLLQSLHDTLLDDPTGVEIIIADDGSTDDSLATARQWATRTWSQGFCSREAEGRQSLRTDPGNSEPNQPIPHPFCTLIELEHCGVLSVVANRLMAAANGEIIVRLDGDVETLTPNWASLLCDAFDAMPRNVGVIGPKQLTDDGFVHSAGDWLLHPRGYHHIAQGITPETIMRSLEVDHVMGCFYCQRRDVWTDIGPYDESIMRGQTVDYGMRARLHGWRCVSIPTIEFVHHHTNRARRTSQSDRDTAIASARDRFSEKWGFDRIAPDLDVVARKYAGTPLLWNARVFGPERPASNTPVPLELSRWHAYAHDERTQQILTNQIQVIDRAIACADREMSHIVQFGCGEGVLCHLLAGKGHEVTGVDTHEGLIDLATQITQRSVYPSRTPLFVHQPDRTQSVIEPGSADVVLLIDTMHSHPNPVGLLKLARQALADDGMLLIIMPLRSTPLDTDVDCHHPYREHELVNQITATRLFTVDDQFAGDTPGALIKLCYPSFANKADPHLATQCSEVLV